MIDFSLLNLHIETKFYKNSMAEFYEGKFAKFIGPLDIDPIFEFLGNVGQVILLFIFELN